MLDKYVGMLSILARSTDELLQRSDIMFNVVVPVALVLSIVLSIFGKKDK